MWFYQVTFALIVLTNSVFGSICKGNEKEEKKFRLCHEEVNWFGALLNCSRQGMTLATVHSQQEQNMLVKAIKESGKQFLRSWIGGSDLHDEGNYIWVSINEPITYKNFKKTQPDNHKKDGDTEHCLEVVHQKIPEFEWNDNFCTRKQRKFVCEYYECCTNVDSL